MHWKVFKCIIKGKVEQSEMAQKCVIGWCIEISHSRVKVGPSEKPFEQRHDMND